MMGVRWMGTWLCFAAITLIVLSCAAVQGAPADWPVFRHDHALTGTSLGKGAITKPEVKWEYDLGVGWTALATAGKLQDPNVADLDGDGTLERFAIDDRTIRVTTLEGELLWTYTVSGHPLGPLVRVGKLLPDRKGLQIVSFSARADTGNGQGYCFAFDKGARNGELVWNTRPLTGQHSPTMMVDDVDGDGLPEVVVAPHYRVMIFDGQNGHIKAEIPWDVGRNYGALLSRPRKGHQHKDIFVVSDFVAHVDCIRYQDGRWVHAWGHKYFDPDPFKANPKGRVVYMRVAPNPVLDVDSDGLDEMVYLFIDGDADDRWHLRARNCETGKIETDIPGIWLWSMADLDKDGRIELVYTRTDAKRPRTFCDIEIGRVVRGGLRALGTLKNVRPVMTNVTLPLDVGSCVDEGLLNVLQQDVDGDGLPEMFFIERSDGKCGDVLKAISLGRQGQVETKWRYERPGHQLNVMHVGPTETEAPVVSVRDLTDTKLLTLNGKGSLVSESDLPNPGGFRTIPIAVDLDCDGINEIVVQNAKQEIVVLKAGKTPSVLWSTQAVGMTNWPGYAFNGPLPPQSGDMDGDGKPELVVAAEDESGNGSLVCLDGGGKTRWKWVVPGCPWGGLQAGVDNWALGRFTGRRGLDALVTMHRRSKGSGEAWMIDGGTGKPVWNRHGTETPKTAVPFQLMPGVGDMNGDGLDEAVCMPFTIYAVLSGKTGKPLYPPVWTSPDDLGHWLCYASPTVCDLDGDGKLDAYLNAPVYHRSGYAAMNAQGKLLWIEVVDYTKGSPGFGPVADFDGDGTVEVIVPVNNGTILCLNGKDGKHKWEAKGLARSDVMAADVNGDGIIEIVFSTKDGDLRAISGKDGSDVWTIPSLGTPIAADVDGDGLLEIVLVDEKTSKLRVIGGAGQ